MSSVKINKRIEELKNGDTFNYKLEDSIFTGLSHCTSLGSLINILKTGFLYSEFELLLKKIDYSSIVTDVSYIKNSEESGESSVIKDDRDDLIETTFKQYPGIYMGLTHLYSPINEECCCYIKINFTLDLLEQNNYHINEDDNCGRIDFNTYIPDNISKYELFILENLNINKNYSNEVIFHDKIPIEAIRSIEIPDKIYDEVIDLLIKNDLKDYLSLIITYEDKDRYINDYSTNFYDDVTFFFPLYPNGSYTFIEVLTILKNAGIDDKLIEDYKNSGREEEINNSLNRLNKESKIFKMLKDKYIEYIKYKFFKDDELKNYKIPHQLSLPVY